MKKHKGKAKQPAAPKEQEAAQRQEWGYEEMLTELEAIVSDAEQRLEQEEL